MQKIVVKVTSFVKTMRFFLDFYGFSKKKPTIFWQNQKNQEFYMFKIKDI